MDDQAPLVGKGAEAVGENLPDSRNTSPANYTSLFAWQPSVQPGALNDNTGSIAYLHEIYSLAMSLETGANPGLIRPLQGRRPDIGSLSMDEIGLKQVLPSLRLVIEQLTAQVRQRAPSASVEQTLALADPSATQPFHAAWEQIKAVLRQRKVSLWEVLRKSDADYPNFTFGNNTSAALRAAMTLSSGLSPELRTALTAGPETARHTVEALKARARQRANVPGEAPKSTAGMFLSKEDRLRRCLGLSRKQLRQMLAVYEPGDGVDQGRSAVRDSAFVTRASAATSATFGARIINQGKAPLYLTAASQGYVSPSGERPVTVKGATEPHYDRMVRMLRLHRATGLSFGDLDMLLASAMTAEGQQDTDFHITPATLRALGLFQHLREAYGVTAPQFTTFIGDMPTCSNGREPAFYDTLFNPSQTSNRESIVLQIDGAAFDPMALEGPDAQTVAQLAQAMKVDEATVRWALARIVAAQNLETPTRSVAVVSACYRLLVMPQVFGIKARELRTFLTALNRFTPIVFEQLAGTPSLATPATAPTIDDADADADADADDTTILDVVAMVMNTAEWAVGHHLDVGVLCALVQAPEPAPVPTRWIEAATRAMEQHDAGDSTTTTGDDTKIDRNDAAVRLAFQQAFQLTDTNLANLLLAWAGVTVEQFIASLGRLRRPAGTTAIHAVPVTGEDVAMWQEIEKRVVAALLFRLSAAGLAAITSHPAWFNIEGESGEGMRPLDFTTLYQLTRYRDWIAGLPQVAGKVGGEDQAHEYLTKVNTDRALTQAQTAAMLARLTGWDLGDIESITDYIDGKTVPGTAEDLRDIDLIMRLHDLARATRVGIDALLDINDLKNDADDASLATAAAALWGGCRAEEALAVEGTHNEAYRDALVGWLIEHGVSDGAANPSTLYVTDVSELSDHLLLDVMTGREPQTSRVAASIASVQTYIHRILTRLEPGHDDNATATADVRERWTNAQSSYGRWQLLAKMRNYPENYLDPTRRRRKTSHYADLENLLAQGKLSESDIQSALFDYLTKFEASANIQPLTAYHDGVDPLHDTYHIIGKSNVSPSGYFWRTLDMSLRAPDDTTSTLGFSEWEPMSVVPTGTITQTTLPARGSRATFASADDKVDFTQEALAEDSRNMIDTIRPVVIDNQRYAVWVERDTTGIPMGSEQKTSPFFELRLCYSVRKLDGLWSVPNVLKTLNGYDDDMTYQGTEENVTSPPAVPDVDAAKSRATTNLSLKTKDFSPGLIVMVNAKGHRKNDPWLTVVLFRSNGALTSLEAGDDYYIASWDKLFLEERSLDTDTTTTGATNADASITAASRANLVEKALVTDWLALFSDPRIVQHQYVGKIMTLAELERDKRAYRIITDAAAKRVTDSYDTRLSRAGTGSLEGGLDDRQDFLELTATFDGAWMPSQDGGPATAVKNEAMAGVVEVSGSEASDVEIFEGSATVDGIAIKMSMPNTVLDATPVTTEWDIPLGEFPSRVKKLRLRLDDVYLIESTLNAPSPNVTKTVHHGSIYGVFHRLAAITILVGFVNQTDQFRIVKVTLTRKKANAIKPTEKSTKPGSARLVLRGGVADSVGTDQPKKISLTHEDELVMARPEFAGIKAFVEGNSEASVAFRSALAVSRRPGSVVTERVKVSHWYDFLMSEYEYTEKEHKRTASELIQAEADALKASIAVVPVPATVDIRQAVALKRHHPETFARFMASAMVGEQVLAEQTFVLDGAPCQIAARFPVNLDIAKYAFTLEVYANEDTDILGRVIRLYELQEPAKDDRDDRAPTTRLIRNGYQAHYLDMTEVKGKIAVAAQRRNAIRLNTLFAKRLAALSFVSAHHAMGWEAQLIVEPRLEPGGEQALVDFRGANGLYFWELFFHVPMLLAWQLRGTRQFREAFDWCARHLFDPYDTVGRSEVYEPPFWHTRPLVDVAPNLAAGESTSTEDVEDHAYAEPERYRKAVFMFLVECWRQQGDDLYRQLTRDGVNEAVDRYRMALRLIGPLPEAQTVSSPTLGSLSGVKGKPFLPPVNVALTQARDLLHHRLFNIRHGLTIDGRVMDLDLYDSADDHASLGDARTGMTSGSRRVGPLSVPPYRFRHVLPLAKDAVATLVDMGRQLFHTYEEEYNAGLSVLQQANLIKLSDFTVELEMQNIAAARAEHDTLLATRRMVEQRRDYYNKLDNDGHYDNETAATSLVAIGKAFTLAAVPFDIVAANVAMFPKIFGLANGGANPEFGPLMTGEVLRRVGETQIYIADELRWQAAFERGRAGWRHEASQAERELEIIDRQMAENDIRMRSANVTLANEKARQAVMREEYVFMTTGFAIGPTYVWMISRLSEVYASAYDAVMSLCLAAQDSCRYETGNFVRRFMKPGAWMDNWRGQLAGEALQRDLLEMEAAYVHRNERRMHIRKVVNLTELNNVTASALAADLVAGREVSLSLKSELYDRDFPGHYLRQIVSVSVALRMKSTNEVQSVAAELTQVTNHILLTDDEDGAAFLYVGKGEKPDSVLADVRRAQRVAISATRPVIDVDGYSGLYSLVFGDDRYLPFEGTGAISTWTLKCPGNQDDLKKVFGSSEQAGETTCRLEEIVLTIDYLAQAGSPAFVESIKARSAIAEESLPKPSRDFVKPRLARQAGTPVVVIPSHAGLEAGSSVSVVYKSGNTVLHEAASQPWNGTTLSIPLASTVLASHAGRAVTFVYTVTKAGQSSISASRSGVIPAVGIATHPRPEVAGMQPNRSTDRKDASDGAIDRRDVPDGATVTVAPWDCIQVGQCVWLRCVGTKENGDSHDYDLRAPGAEVTEAEMAGGLRAVIPLTYLQELGDYASLQVIMKAALNASESEDGATAFPPLTLDIPKCGSLTVAFGALAAWSSIASPSRPYDLGYVALLPEVGPVSLSLDGTQKRLHIVCDGDFGGPRTIHCDAIRRGMQSNGSWAQYRVDSAREVPGRNHYYTTSLGMGVNLSANPDLPPGRYRGRTTLQLIGWQVPRIVESIRVELDVVAPPLQVDAPGITVSSAGAPGVVIPANPRVPSGATVRLYYKTGTATEVPSEPMAWNGSALTLPIAPTILATNRGKVVAITYAVEANGTVTRADSIVVTIPASATPTWPEPVVAAVRANHAIDRRDVPEGAVVTLAPWPYIHKNQGVRLRCVGTKADGKPVTLDLRGSPDGVTEAELTDGIRATIPLSYLNALGNRSRFAVVMKVGANGALEEQAASPFPELVLDVPACYSMLVSSTEWRQCDVYNRDGEELGFVVIAAALGPVALTQEGTSRNLQIPLSNAEGKTVDAALVVTRWTTAGGVRQEHHFDSYKTLTSGVPTVATLLLSRWGIDSNATLPASVYRGHVILHAIGAQTGRVRAIIRVDVNVDHLAEAGTPNSSTFELPSAPPQVTNAENARQRLQSIYQEWAKIYKAAGRDQEKALTLSQKAHLQTYYIFVIWPEMVKQLCDVEPTISEVHYARSANDAGVDATVTGTVPVSGGIRHFVDTVYIRDDMVAGTHTRSFKDVVS